MFYAVKLRMGLFLGNPNHHQRERRLTLSDPLDGIGDIEKFLIKMNFKLMERDVNLKVRTVLIEL